MSLPPGVIPARRRRHRRRKMVAASGPVALTLVAADWDSGIWVQLTFNQAIDISGIVGGQITVSDPDATGVKYEAVGPRTLITPQTVRIELLDVSPVGGEGVTLNVGAGNGIVAVAGGSAFAGVSNLTLPFP